MKERSRVLLPAVLFCLGFLLGVLFWAHLPDVLESDSPPAGRVGGNGRAASSSASIGSGDHSDAPSNDGSGTADPQPEDDGREVDIDARIEHESRRTPPEHELKPDIARLERDEAAARDKAAKRARQQSVAARGAIEEELVNGQSLSSRVVWAMPAASSMGQATAPYFAEHYCGPAGKHPAFDKEVERLLAERLTNEDASELRKALTQSFAETTLLVGRVELPQAGELVRQAWTGLQQPPIVVTVGGLKILANAGGWFAIYVAQGDWKVLRERGVSAYFPGYALLEELKLAQKPDEQTPVTLSLLSLPLLAITVDVSPQLATQSALRAWLEVRQPVVELPTAYAVSPALFIESDVPQSGRLTFLVPDPRTITGDLASRSPVRFGVAGDGWTGGPPRVVASWEYEADNHRREGKVPPELLRVRSTLLVERAATDLVSGRCRVPGLSAPVTPVRIESKHTGTVTYTDTTGAFQLWCQVDRGNWKRMLQIDPVRDRAFDFCIDYDEPRPPNVALRKGGTAPLGPWDVNLAAPTGGSMYVWLPDSKGESDVLVESRDGWIPLRLVYGESGWHVPLCVNWPAWVGEVALRDRRTGVVQPAEIEWNPVADSVLPMQKRIRDANGKWVAVVKIKAGTE